MILKFFGDMVKVDMGGGGPGICVGGEWGGISQGTSLSLSVMEIIQAL